MSYLANENRYDTMKYNRCGRSGLMLPAISLGLWHNFGDVDNVANQKKMLFRAFDLGITHFDLANNYGPSAGSAEENFGRILNEEMLAYRDEMIISTKAGYHMWPGPYGDNGSKKYLTASLDQSLKRMNLDYVDIFYSHRPDPNTPIEETVEALADAVRQGKALYVGISSYNPEQTKAAVEALKVHNLKCLIHQPSYSMLNRWIEDGLQDVLEEEGIGSIAFSPLAQGMLTDKYLKGIPADSRAARETGFLQESAVTEDKLKKIALLKEIADNRGQTMAQMALSWVLRGGRVTTVLIGASRVEQIEENVKILSNLDFSTEELDKIDNILKG